MVFRRVILMFRKVVYCSGGLCAVKLGYYMLIRMVISMFRRVKY